MNFEKKANDKIKLVSNWIFQSKWKQLVGSCLMCQLDENEKRDRQKERDRVIEERMELHRSWNTKNAIDIVASSQWKIYTELSTFCLIRFNFIETINT